MYVIPLKREKIVYSLAGRRFFSREISLGVGPGTDTCLTGIGGMLSLFEIVHALFLAYLELFDSKNR